MMDNYTVVRWCEQSIKSRRKKEDEKAKAAWDEK